MGDNVTDHLASNLTLVATQMVNGMNDKVTATKEHTGLGLSQATVIVVTSFLGLVIVVAVIGNIIALVALHMFRELRTSPCYFITNLCISDLLVSFLSLPFWISFIRIGWPSQEDGLVYKLWICLDIFCGSFSITNLTLISIERYTYIVYPLNFESIITKKRAKLLTGATPLYGVVASLIGFIRMQIRSPYLIIPVVILTYVIPVAVMCFANGSTYIITLSHLKFMEQQEKDRRRLIKAQRKRKQQTATADSPSTLIKMEGIKEWEEYVNSIESKGLSSGGLCERNVQEDHKNAGNGENESLCKEAADQDADSIDVNGREAGTQQRSLTTSDIGHHNQPAQDAPKPADVTVRKKRCPWRLRSIKRELKAAKAICLVIGTFLLLWTPFMVVVLLYSFNVEVKFQTAMIVKCLHYTNSAINPILYVALNKTFRSSLRRLPTRVRF